MSPRPGVGSTGLRAPWGVSFGDQLDLDMGSPQHNGRSTGVRSTGRQYRARMGAIICAHAFLPVVAGQQDRSRNMAQNGDCQLCPGKASTCWKHGRGGISFQSCFPSFLSLCVRFVRLVPGLGSAALEHSRPAVILGMAHGTDLAGEQVSLNRLNRIGPLSKLEHRDPNHRKNYILVNMLRPQPRTNG